MNQLCSQFCLDKQQYSKLEEPHLPQVTTISLKLHITVNKPAKTSFSTNQIRELGKISCISGFRALDHRYVLLPPVSHITTVLELVSLCFKFRVSRTEAALMVSDIVCVLTLFRLWRTWPLGYVSHGDLLSMRGDCNVLDFSLFLIDILGIDQRLELSTPGADRSDWTQRACP